MEGVCRERLFEGDLIKILQYIEENEEFIEKG